MINLLPPRVKSQAIIKTKTSNTIFAYSLLLAALILFIAGFFTYNFTQTSAIADKESELATLAAQRKKISAQATKLAFIQDRLTVAGQFQEKADWNSLLNTIASDTPKSIQLSDLKITVDPAKGTTATITGQTANRRDIVLFQGKLATEKSLTGVTILSMNETNTTIKAIAFVIQAGTAKQ